jgi:hypothetical protein
LTGGLDRLAMPLFARHLLPVVESRHRPKHRPGGGAPADAARGVPAIPRPPAFEPASPARALAMVALAVLRRSKQPAARPAGWSVPGFAREVDLIRLHLAPIRSRPVLAASFGREAFHGDATSTSEVAATPVTVAYALRWLERGDGIARPLWSAWLAEAAPGPREPVAIGLRRPDPAD